MISNADIERNLKQYLYSDDKRLGISPFERYASFDYCFNYFQSFKDNFQIKKLASKEYLQISCLQLAFFLASWGMYRGSSFLLQKSAKSLEPIISLIANSNLSFWEIDANCYSNENIKQLIEFNKKVKQAFIPNYPSDILVTKIMLGVYGNVPAFDTFFKRGFGVSIFGKMALGKIGDFYQEYRELIEQYRNRTLSFETGKFTKRYYTRAKVIDMIFFIEGMKTNRNTFDKINLS